MSNAMVEVGSQSLRHEFKYSIGTLVTDRAQYGDCVRSFQKAGFSEDCEFLFIDNSENNAHTAFDGLNHILNQARGEFMIEPVQGGQAGEAIGCENDVDKTAFSSAGETVRHPSPQPVAIVTGGTVFGILHCYPAGIAARTL